jgi:thymidylate synthase (FAD)
MNKEKSIMNALDLIPEKTIRCLDHGFVTLVDVMPGILPEGQTADYAIVQAARVSYGVGTKNVSEDRGLIRYLMRHQHTTPLEMVEWKFLCKMPMFVARQWIRHRTANVNEYSARYSVVPDQYYIPNVEIVRKQSKKNKQGGTEEIDTKQAQSFITDLKNACHDSYENYEDFIEKDIARELARCILPINYYTEWYWKIDLHNLFHFLALRCDSHAQYEIRVFADAMLKLITPIVPWAVEAWNDYHPMRQAIKLTRLEVDALKLFLQGGQKENLTSNFENKREKDEWQAKLLKLGITV